MPLMDPRPNTPPPPDPEQPQRPAGVHICHAPDWYKEQSIQRHLHKANSDTAEARYYAAQYFSNAEEHRQELFKQYYRGPAIPCSVNPHSGLKSDGTEPRSLRPKGTNWGRQNDGVRFCGVVDVAMFEEEMSPIQGVWMGRSVQWLSEEVEEYVDTMWTGLQVEFPAARGVESNTMEQSRLVRI